MGWWEIIKQACPRPGLSGRCGWMRMDRPQENFSGQVAIVVGPAGQLRQQQFCAICGRGLKISPIKDVGPQLLKSACRSAGLIQLTR